MAIYKGQAFAHRFRAKDAAGAPAVLTGIPMIMHIREYPESPTTDLVLSTANGKLVVQDDYIDVILTAADTTALPATGLRAFDIKRSDNDARICGGKVRVKQGVTRS